MSMFKSSYRRSFLSLVITGILLVSFAAVPLSMLIQSVAAAPYLTPTPYKWRRTGLGSGASGVLIADVLEAYDGEEVFWVGQGRVTCMRGDTGATIWTKTSADVSMLQYVWYWNQPQMADLDLDGIPEIIITYRRWQNNGLIVLHGDDGSVYWTLPGLRGNTMTSSPVIGDIDGDGYPTIFVASEAVVEVADRPEERDDNGLDYTARLYAISHTGSILDETHVWRACAGGLSLADADRDGVYELYMGDRHMYMSDGDWGKGVRSFWAENLSVRWNYPDWLCSSQAPTLADVNGDGILEVVVSNQRGGLMLLDSRTGAAIRKDSNLNLPMHYQASVADVDGDGNLEICMADGDHLRYAELNVTVFDLVEWTVDARIHVDNPAVENSSRCMYGPQLADVTGDGLVEIIACSYLGVHVIDPRNDYEVIDEVVWSGTPWDEEDRPNGVKTTFAVVQDIDGDDLVEVVVASHNGEIRAWDTPASVPNPRARTEVQFCSELRQGVAVNVPPPGQELEPIISAPSPGDKAVDVLQTLSELTFTLIDHQGDTLDYTVETFPDIGSDFGTVPSGTPISVSIDPLSYSQVYSWQVNVTDGTHWTNRTFIFRTEYESVSNVPPSLDNVNIDGGDGTSGDFLTCNGESSDGDGVLEPVVNVYNWRVGGDSLTTLLLPCDIRSATTANDYSGYGNDATLHGPTWTSEGIVGGCYEFDGDDDYATISHSASLGGSGTWSEITVELWVYLSQDQQDTRLIAKIPSYEIGFSSRGNNMLFAGVWTDTFEYDEETDEASIYGQYQSTSSYGLSTDAWHHVAMTYRDGEGIILYVNGTAVAVRSHKGNIKPTAGSAPGSAEPVYLGWFDYFEGKIDEVRMYRRALSPEQIYQRYTETKDGDTSSSTIVPQETARGEVWMCDVTPNDRLTDGTMQDDSIGPLANGLPMVFNPRAHAPGRTRQLALTTEDVVASYDYFDWDDDPEGITEIQWYIDTVYDEDYDNLPVIPFTETSAGESWYFMVRPHDGYGFGEWETSISVLIRANLPPEHTTPLIPSSGYTGDDLLCLNQSTYDDDGDEVTNIYNWFNDSISFTNLLMPFDTESFTTAKDYSGYGNDGDIFGATWTEDGVVGGAYTFNGSNYIRVTENGNSLGGDGNWQEISVEFWIKATGTTSTEAVVFKHDEDFSFGGWQEAGYGVGYLVEFRAYDDRDRFYWSVYNDTGTEEVQFSDYDNFGEWHHVVCTYDSDVGLELYVDGIVQDSTPFTGNINATLDGILDIGGYGDGIPDYGGYGGYGGFSGNFSGMLDEVRIYPKALSSAQVLHRYTETKDGLSSSSTIASEETTIGEDWYCEVTPNDSWEDGSPLDSNTVHISDVSPTLYNVHLESEQDTAATFNLGSITFDTVSYSLPNDVSKPADSYSAEYFAAATYEFDHWEFSGGVSVSVASANPTTVTVSEAGTLRAIYSEIPPTLYNVHLESVEDPATTNNLGTITFDAVSYSLPNDELKEAGDYSAEYFADSGYAFDHWAFSGDVSVTETGLNPTTVTVSGEGTLQAVYTEIPPTLYNVDLESVEDPATTSNLGSITFGAVSYSLPNAVSKEAGDYSAEYFADSGYEFDHWETTGGLSVSVASANPATVTVSDAGTLQAVYTEIPGWDVVLTASKEGYNDVSEFGVRSDATDDFDPAYDAIDPPPPVSGVVSYFWYPDNTPPPPIDYRKLSTSKIPPSSLMTWTYNVTAIGIDGTMYITWSASEIATIPSEYGVHLHTPQGPIINMRTVTEYSFTAAEGTTYTFTIYVGGCYFELLLSSGWNMVSFPCIPMDDASFSNIFSDISFYQVLTWDGTSYVTPTIAEAGKGYWVLVLEDATVTIYGMPVESYELDLPAGWSMIGSIYPCTVDADLVFPDFYQLLTWDGTGYVTVTTIEPGKGYWALVLVETHIVVDESCSV